MFALASLYYYRDGLNLSASAVPSAAGVYCGITAICIAVSMLACVPAARSLAAQSVRMPRWICDWARPVALPDIVCSFTLMRRPIIPSCARTRWCKRRLPDDSGQRAGRDFRRRAGRDRAGLSRLRTRDADRRHRGAVARCVHGLARCAGAQPPDKSDGKPRGENISNEVVDLESRSFSSRRAENHCHGADRIIRLDSSSMTRVLHIVSGNLYGGVETFVATLARYRDTCPALDQQFAFCFDGRFAQTPRGRRART